MSLIIRQRTRSRGVDVVFLKGVIRKLLHDILKQPVAELGIYLVDVPEMTRLNELFLQHQGPTDVITFDYAESGPAHALAGEVFVCLEVALLQAAHFKADWPTELVRYIVHGILHLQGFDDKSPAKRARMKQEENRLVRTLAERFPLARVGKSKSARLKTAAPKKADQN